MVDFPKIKERSKELKLKMKQRILRAITLQEAIEKNWQFGVTKKYLAFLGAQIIFSPTYQRI